jgi:hypothetical protein
MTDQRARLIGTDRRSMLRTNTVTQRQASSKSSIEMMRMCLQPIYFSANITDNDTYTQIHCIQGGKAILQERVLHLYFQLFLK